MGREIAEILEVSAVREASRLLIEGVSDADTLDDLAAKFPGVDARRVLAVVVEQLSQAARCDREVVVGFALEAYREIYRQALERGELAEALKAVKELVSLARSTADYVLDDKPAAE